MREESIESENEERPVDGRGQVERKKGVPIKSLHQDMVEIYYMLALSGYVSLFFFFWCIFPPSLLLSSLSWEFWVPATQSPD